MVKCVVYFVSFETPARVGGSSSRDVNYAFMHFEGISYYIIMLRRLI